VFSVEPITLFSYSFCLQFSVCYVFCVFMLHYMLYCLHHNLVHLIVYLLNSALQYTLHYYACLCMLHASPQWLMPLKQSLASSALYLINPNFISSFSACCRTFKGGCAGEGGGQNKKNLWFGVCVEFGTFWFGEFS